MKTMKTMKTRIVAKGRPEAAAEGERGFALVLAILALMLLTFLGLTLAATSSTELQIATNYRWSLQAFYNAEAGLEVAKAVMREYPVALDFSGTLPPVRAPWTGTPAAPDLAAVAGTDAWGNPLRQYENYQCDTRNSVGYGLIMSLPPLGSYQYVTTAYGHDLNGAFTLWVRRVVNPQPDGNLAYLTGADADTDFIVVAEGVAPYTGGAFAPGGVQAFAQANKAVRVLEARLSRAQGEDPCARPGGPQIGGGSQGSGFASCASLEGGTGPGSGSVGALTQGGAGAGIGSGGAGGGTGGSGIGVQ